MAKRTRNTAATIRMYRQGIGDCFLVSIPRNGSRPFRMLIDCGVVLGASGKRRTMTAIAEDIVASLGDDPTIDVLVLTHEHYDHVAGFAYAQEAFGAITFAEVWTAWTEKEDDPLANRLRENHDRSIRAFAGLHDKLSAIGAEGEARELASVLFGSRPDFPLGDPDEEDDPGGDGLFAARRITTADAFSSAKALAGGRQRILSPHTMVDLPADVPVRVFVLGPPYDEEKIGRTSPDPDNPETFGLEAMGEAVLALEGWLDGGNDSRDDHPFSPQQEIPLDALLGDPLDAPEPSDVPEDHPTRAFASRLAAARDHFAKRYFAPTVEDRYNVKVDQGYRRIDGGLLSGYGRLALQLDAYTNNTSLAFAIELGDGRVLLFPGDAQVGNCLSWHDAAFETDGRSVTCEDLLARAVFYKVGHHGSHNGTLRERGLDLMEALRFAFIPVDREVAAKIGWTAMPLPELVDALDRRVDENGGIVLRADETPPKQRPDVTVTPLYFELTL